MKTVLALFMTLIVACSVLHESPDRIEFDLATISDRDTSEAIALNLCDLKVPCSLEERTRPIYYPTFRVGSIAQDVPTLDERRIYV